MSAGKLATPEISRRTALGIGAAGVMALLAGCARGTESMPAPAGIVTLNSDNPTWDPGYAAASKVLKQRMGYGIRPRSVASVSNYQQVIRMSAQTGSTTDLVKWANGYRLQDLARGDIMSDLDDVWDSAVANGWVNPAQRESFSYKGTAYAVPLYTSYYAMFYSKKVFAEHGLQVPTTFDELLSVAKALKSAGVVPIQSPGADTWESQIWFQQLVAGIDPDYYRAVTNNDASYEDAPAKEAMELWSTMYADGLFSAPDTTAQNMNGMLSKGTFGMMLYGTWFANALVTAGYGSDDIGLFRVPAVHASAKPAIFTESGALFVPVNAHKREAAKRVAKNWLATDVQQAWIGFLGDTSPNSHAVPKEAFIRELAADVNTVKPVPLTRYWEASPPALIEGNVQDLSSFMVNPTKQRAQSTLSSMQKRATDEWKVWASE